MDGWGMGVGWRDGWVEGRREGWMDGWMDIDLQHARAIVQRSTCCIRIHPHLHTAWHGMADTGRHRSVSAVFYHLLRKAAAAAICCCCRSLLFACIAYHCFACGQGYQTTTRTLICARSRTHTHIYITPKKKCKRSPGISVLHRSGHTLSLSIDLLRASR